MENNSPPYKHKYTQNDLEMLASRLASVSPTLTFSKFMRCDGLLANLGISVFNDKIMYLSLQYTTRKWTISQEIKSYRGSLPFEIKNLCAEALFSKYDNLPLLIGEVQNEAEAIIQWRLDIGK